MRFASEALAAFACNEAGMPFLKDIIKLFEHPGAVIHLLLMKGILKDPPVCPVCDTTMDFKSSIYVPRSTPLELKPADRIGRDCYKWRCTKRHCEGRNTSKSILKNSVFEGIKVQPHTLLAQMYHYLRGEERKNMIMYVDTTKNTITMHNRLVRLIIGKDLEGSEYKIGGPGIQIQVDESKFGRKFKHNRGMRGDKENALDLWVIGGIESEPRPMEKKRRAFAILCANRNKLTINEVFRKNVAPGTHVVTDGWKGYFDLKYLEDCDFTHTVVNHTECFKDPETGAHTNTQEGKPKCVLCL